LFHLISYFINEQRNKIQEFGTLAQKEEETPKPVG